MDTTTPNKYIDVHAYGQDKSLTLKASWYNIDQHKLAYDHKMCPPDMPSCMEQAQ